MLLSSIWIKGPTRSGKTTYLVEKFAQWVNQELRRRQESTWQKSSQQLTSAILVFAANDDNRRSLADKLSAAVQGSYPVVSKTPLGFISEEVKLFWPLLFERLNLKAQFPLRLRPETEQELATSLWQPELEKGELQLAESGSYRLVRRTLDLLQLAGASGIPAEDILTILEQGLPEQGWEISIILNPVAIERDKQVWQEMSKLLLAWRQWCLERGLLSYGIIYELYWRYLLPNEVYQHHLNNRYGAIFADDVDDYPAVSRDLFDFLLDQGAMGVFTYNPNGQIRLGLNADPIYLSGLASRCQIEELSSRRGLAVELEESVIQLVTDPTFIISLPDCVQSIQTTSRAQLLRKTAEVIIQAIKTKKIQPEEIVIIAPGLDEIARYTLIEILSHQGIPVKPLNEQRSLISSPLVRSLLTLLGLVYSGLGRLVDRDSVAEMLVILSQKPRESEETKEIKLIPDIDPVRAGLLADYCYFLDLEQPHLLAVESFTRWDRLGYKATTAYREIVEWIEKIRSQSGAVQLQKQLFPDPVTLVDQAIKKFFPNGSNLPYPQLAALRELMETAQHYWEVERRLRQNEPLPMSQTTTVAKFIQLLRRGTITANPRPGSTFGVQQKAVSLATIFQYRSLRSSHRWQFWLDAGSNLWEKGGAATLFAAPLFLRKWSGKPWIPENEVEEDKQRLQRILRDLLGRVTERIYLCHSNLGVNGNEQTGPLLTLVQASRESN